MIKDIPLVHVSKIGSLKKGGAILREKLRPDGAAVVLYGDIYTKYGEIVSRIISRVDPDAVTDGVRLNTGDIVFAGSGETAEEIGKCIAYVGTEDAYAGGDVVILTNHGQDGRYLGYALNAEDAVRQKMRLGQGSSVMHLYKDDVASIQIPLPPLAEQRKIAEILRTWDEAIETAEAELKAKQERKRWIMKTLLSSSPEQAGSLSLRGCIKVKLEEICDVEWGNSELTKSCYIPNGKYLAVSAAGCDGRIDHSEHKKNTPVISAIGANCGRMFLPTEDFTAIKNTITITPKESIADGRYLYETLTFLELPKRGGAQPFMSKGDIDNFKIPLPTLQEQKKIAEILQSAEADIEVIKQRIESFRNQKRGLMQKLLTGEIRVAV